MKLVHAIWSLNYGGAETLLIQLMNIQCIDNNITLIIINNNIDQELYKLIDKRISIIKINRPLKSRNPFYFLKLSCKLFTLRNTIIHFHQDNIIEYAPINRLLKYSCLTVHCVLMDVKSLFKYKHLFAISTSVQKQIKIESNLDSTLIYNGINCDAFKKHNYKKTIDDDLFKIVQIGRLDHELKGQDITIKAAALLRDKYSFSKFRIDLIGEGESDAYLSNLIEDLDLSDLVIMKGNKSLDFIRENLCKYDLLLQPSNYEGFGLVVIEGISAQIPVLASNVDGLSEIIKNNQYGYLFEKGNVEDLANKIWEIIHEPDSKKIDLVERAYLHAYNQFNITVTSKNYLNAYSQILNQ